MFGKIRGFEIEEIYDNGEVNVELIGSLFIRVFVISNLLSRNNIIGVKLSDVFY